MKLYSLCVIYKGATKANVLKAAYDLSSFSFFQRSGCVNRFFRVWILKSMAILTFNSVDSQKHLCFLLLSVQEFMTFTSALIVERSTQGSRASVKEQGKKKKKKRRALSAKNNTIRDYKKINLIIVLN